MVILYLRTHYSIEFAISVRKDFKKIAKEDVKRIIKAIEKLAEEPRSPSTKKLINEELYRLRVGVYRVVYEIHDEKLVILIVKAGYRRKIYRK